MAANDEGYLSWEEPYILPSAYFNGRFLDGTPPMTWQREIGVNRIPVWSGATRRQSPYVGEKAPQVHQEFRFTLELFTNALDDLRAFEDSIADPDSAVWVPGLYARDKFQAISGQAYTLLRGRATELSIAGVDGTSFPTIVYVDGVLNDGSAITWIDGQRITANTTALITVRYCAAFLVSVVDFPGKLPEEEALTHSVSLVEDLQGDMG